MERGVDLFVWIDTVVARRGIALTQTQALGEAAPDLI